MTRTLTEVDRERLEWQHKRKVLKAQFYANAGRMSDTLITRYRTLLADYDDKLNELHEETITLSKPN